jgi:hypothetical protein
MGTDALLGHGHGNLDICIAANDWSRPRVLLCLEKV